MWKYRYTDSELYHHGVKGMKWGVRKYRNDEGSYVKKGLAVFDKNMADYDAANQKVKSLKGGDKVQYKSAIAEREKAKFKLDKSYDQLKQDRLAEQGRKLYEKGKTITSNSKVNYIAQAAIVAGSEIADRVISAKTGNRKLARISSLAIGAGATAVNVALGIKTSSENKKLRAYYGHSRQTD